MVTFEFEGYTYEISDTHARWACKHALDVMLPDGRLLRPGGWLESSPPIPTGLRVVNIVHATKCEDDD